VRVRLAAVGALACALVFMVGGAGAVPSTSLVISQVYGGGGNSGATYTHDFIELFNRGSSPVSLSGWSVQYASAAGSTWQRTNLTAVTLQPGQYYLVQESQGSGGTAPLPTPDATGTIFMSATSAKVALVSNQTTLTGSCPSGSGIVDFVGYGSSANCFETSPTATLTNTTAALRGSGGCTETDNNAADFAAGAPSPRNTASPLNVCSGPPSLSIDDVSAQEGNSGTTPFSFTVSLSSPAGPGGVTFDVATADGTANEPSDYAAQSLTGQTIPAGSSSYSFTVQVNGDETSEPDESFFVNVTNVTGASVTDAQGLGTIVNDDVCGQPFTPIYDIQGSGAATPIPGNVSTEGIVVGDFEGSSGVQGFYLQDATGDGDSATSDGIFVFTGSGNLVSAGQHVRVTGFARERFNETTINGANSNSSPVTNVVACGTGGVAPTDVLMPFAALDAPERYEGMLVRLPQPLVIAEYFNYERFGELVLAQPLDGESRPFTPTLLEEPGPPAQNRLLQNQLRRITLDDGLGSQNPALVRHPNGDFFSLANRFRGGDTVANTTGVLGFAFNLYRIQPTAPADYEAVNPRPAAPAEVGGRITAAAFNMLNYFLTLDYPSSDPRNNTCGASQDMECRGADSDQPNEFERQRVKLLEALAGLDADVVGVNEIENTPGVDPLADIAVGLNSMLGAGTYDRIDTGVIGPDAIRVGLIYKPGEVTPVGDFKILNDAVDPRFIEDRSRPALAQTFEELASGARFTVVVNHLKSKGSACALADDGHFDDPDTGDGQGNCNVTRTLAAQALVDWLVTDPTGSGDPDFLITGDLNSYAMEDPIDAIKAGPDDAGGTADDYSNLISDYLGPFAYSFVFDGMAGYLDHALSNASLTPQVTGVTEWHINADEPDILDYDTSFKPDAQDALYEPNAYRSSDHDPVLVGLEPQTTFAGLCRATERAVSDADVAASLCDKLRAAEAAEARGNEGAKAGALRAYVKQVRAQTGKTISAEDAELLIELASTL
jgi:predicted extracellular nuclease